jgi:hypothetical protein
METQYMENQWNGLMVGGLEPGNFMTLYWECHHPN